MDVDVDVDVDVDSRVTATIDPQYCAAAFEGEVSHTSEQVTLEPIVGLDRAAQHQWMQSLRSQAAHIELLFHDGDADHPMIRTLAWLNPRRQVGVGVRPGYHRPRPSAVLHRYPYERAILQALEDLSGIFDYVSTPNGDVVQVTGLGMSTSPSSTGAARFSG